MNVKDAQATGEVFRNIKYFKTWNFFTFLWVIFVPFWIRIQQIKLIGSESETLERGW
jgi:hypothetical protein